MESAVADKQTFSAPDGGVAAVERAFSIMAALERADGPVALADLSRITGLYKSTILRLMISLEHNGYATRLRDGCYDLGPAAIRLGLAYERKNALRAHVLPVLQDLVGRGTESASFHVRQDGEHRLCLYRVDSHHSTLDRVTAGETYPMKVGAAGRVLLAFEEPASPSSTAIIAHGWALSLGERDPACAGLAAPVFGAAGLLGALSLSGPRERFGAAEIDAMRALLMPLAADLTRRLGGTWPRFSAA